MGAHEHRAHGQAAVACAVLTASDTRTRDTDTSGARARALLEAAGHRVVASAILPDDPARIRAWIEERLADPTVDVVVVNGGTGLAPCSVRRAARDCRTRRWPSSTTAAGGTGDTRLDRREGSRGERRTLALR